MPEIFLGELSEVKFFDLIKPLLIRKNTGILTIKGKEHGAIYLETGKIVHAKTTHSSGEESFLAIMGWKTGRATFLPDVGPREKTITTPTEELVLNWSYRKQEWEKMRKVVPSSSAIFRISLRNDSGDKMIKGDQWNVLALTNGTRSVLEIANTLDWDEFRTSKAIYHLVQAGLIEKVEEKGLQVKRYIGENFFRVMENELKRAMGPVAPFIIDDKLIEVGEVKDSFPEDQVLPFVEGVGEEIPNERKRDEFKKAMMGFLSHEK